MQNWAGNLTYRASEIAQPRSLEEAREFIAAHRKVRLVGTRHCFNDIADSATMLNLSQLPSAIEISPARDSVKVSGFLRYGDIAPVLEAEGLMLANLASLPHISVAGAIATGTHGSGDGIGSLATAVRALTILTASGDIREITRGDADFNGAVVSLGALGAVLEVTLDVQPSVPFAQLVFEGPRWDAMLEDLDAVTGVGTSVSIFTRWLETERADMIWVKQAQPDARAEARAALAHGIGAVAAAGKRHPIIGVDPVATTDQLGIPGPWFQRLPHFRLDFEPSAGEEIQSEYLVPRADAPDAIEAIRSLAHRIAPLLLVNEIRTFRADDLWLSGGYGTDAVGIHFTWKRDEEAVRALLPVIEAALPDTARPHWGKVFTLPGDAIRERYERFDDFAALRDRFDPNRVFVNEYLERLGL